jgi:hypothetical protein
MTDRAALLEQVAAIFDAELRTMLRTVWTLGSDVIAKHFAERALSLAEATLKKATDTAERYANYRKHTTSAEVAHKALGASEIASLLRSMPITLPPIGDADKGRVEG